MHTENRRRLPNRRKKSVLPKLIIACIVISLPVLSFVYYLKYNKREDYSLDDRFQAVFVENLSTTAHQGFADGLAIVSGNVGEIDDFESKVGLAIKYDDSEVVFSKEALTKMPPASTTKIMTALIALKYGNITDEVTVPEAALINEAGTSLAGLKAGDRLTLEELIYAIMLPSGNDAANTIAYHIAGSEREFVKLMNEEAKKIGAVDTHFVNAHGLPDDEHYTSAYDLYLMLNEAMKYDTFIRACKTTTYEARYFDADNEPVQKHWTNTNRYLDNKYETVMPENMHVIAGKTGTTLAAGHCLVLATEDIVAHRYISIILNADNKNMLYDNMSKLLVSLAQ